MLLVRFIYIEQVLLDNRLYILCLAGRRIDKDGKHPGLSVRHIDVSGKILGAGYRTALGMNTSFERRARAERFERSALSANRQ